jgi:hypothetical protein
METDRLFISYKVEIIKEILLLFVLGSNMLFSQDKDKIDRGVLFGIQHQAIKIDKKSTVDSIKISLKYRPKLNEVNLFNSTPLPLDPTKIDYRRHPYYTPQIVDDFINENVMGRPSASSFVSLPTIALMAAAIAVQYAAVQLKMEIKAADYLVDEKFYSIIFALWDKSPQTVEELYRIKIVAKNRTIITLQRDLDQLVDKRLLKMRKIPKSSTKYFPAKKRSEVVQMFENCSIEDSSGLQKLIYLKKRLLY